MALNYSKWEPTCIFAISQKYVDSLLGILCTIADHVDSTFFINVDFKTYNHAYKDHLEICYLVLPCINLKWRH